MWSGSTNVIIINEHRQGKFLANQQKLVVMNNYDSWAVRNVIEEKKLAIWEPSGVSDKTQLVSNKRHS